MEQMYKHWWNGTRSPSTRRDVLIYTDGHQWSVEARTGGRSESSRRQRVRNEAEALALADRWCRLGGPSWKDVSRLHSEPPWSREQASGAVAAPE